MSGDLNQSILIVECRCRIEDYPESSSRLKTLNFYFQCADSSPDVQIKQQPAEIPTDGSAPRRLPPALANLAEVWRALLARDRAFWRLVTLLAALFACLGWWEH